MQTLYPGYNVLDSTQEWDKRTKEVVLGRLGPFPPLQYLTEQEEAMLRSIAGHLLYEDREEIIDWIVSHIDQELVKPTGESHRKPGTPPMAALVRGGLRALEQVSVAQHQTQFTQLGTGEQFAILASVQLGQAISVPGWEGIPQKDFFNKLLEFGVTAYYSHPTIWSEIGHGGPAYPRGYYRIELGWRDPWEAQMERGDEDGIEPAQL